MTDIHSNADTATGAQRITGSMRRFFWVGMAVFFILIVFLGFGSTYGRQLVLGLEISGNVFVETDWVIHLHAAVMVGWMALLLMQTVLVARGRTRTHMALGAYGGPALGAAILLVGGLITYTTWEVAVSEGVFTWPGAILVLRAPWLALIEFIALTAVGLLYRHRPAVHKRCMMLATAALVMAAVGRMEYLLGPWRTTIGFGLMIVPLVAYDLYTEARVHRATLLGSGVVGISVVSSIVRHLSG